MPGMGRGGGGVEQGEVEEESVDWIVTVLPLAFVTEDAGCVYLLSAHIQQ